MPIRIFILQISLLALFNKGLAQRPIDKLAITNVHIVSMDSSMIKWNQTILIRNNIIEKISGKNEVKITKDYNVIDGKGKFVMPGMSDMHVHLYTEGELMIYLSFGITQVFNLDSKPPAHLEWKKRSFTKNVVLPYIYSCGPKFNGQWTGNQASLMVEKEKSDGYDAIKIYNNISDRDYEAVMKKAKDLGMVTIGHIARSPEWRKTLANQQNIAHLEEFIYTYFSDTADYSRIDSLVAYCKSANITIVPTISAYQHILEQAIDLNNYFKNHRLSTLIKPLLEKRMKGRNIYAKGFSDYEKKKLPDFMDLQKKLLRKLFLSGVNIASGTDASDVGPVPGFGLIEELRMYSEIGVSPYEILKTTTINSARLLKHENEWGTIQPGMRASLLFLNSNPLTKIAAVQNIFSLYHNGNLFTAADLSKLRMQGIKHFKNTVDSLEVKSRTDINECLQYINHNDPYLVFASALLENLSTQNWSEFIKFFEKINSIEENSKLTSEAAINSLGYRYVSSRKWDIAEKVFLLNIKHHPLSANCYDSMGEFYYIRKDMAKAKEFYKKALDIDPNYPNAEYARKIVEGK